MSDSGQPEPYPSRFHSAEQMQRYLAAPDVSRWSSSNLWAAWWTWRSLRRVVHLLEVDGVRAVAPRPPALPPGARRGVDAVLRRTSPTCLERCLVLQAWLAAQGVPCEVVVGVSGDARNVDAHAWLDVEASAELHDRYQEIHRLAPT